MRHPAGLQLAMATTDQGALFSGGERKMNSSKKTVLLSRGLGLGAVEAVSGL